MRIRVVLILALLLVAIGSALGAGPLRVRHHALIRVHGRDSAHEKQLLTYTRLDFAPPAMPGEYLVIALPEDMDFLVSHGYTYDVIHPDLEDFYGQRMRSEGHLDDMGGFHTYDEMAAALDSIHAAHPDITTEKFSAGNTLQGRPMWVMKISDNPDVDEDQPELFYNAMTHAREPEGMEVLLYFMRYLTDNYGSDPEATELVNTREFFFMPIVNPDGYEYNRLTVPGGGGMWRKNRRPNGDGSYGIDLNRNYGVGWGLDDNGSSPFPSDETYRGTAAFSEPETQVIRDFVNSRHFAGSLDYHTFADDILIPWGTSYYQGTGLTVDDPSFETILDSMATAIQGVFGTVYATGTPWQILYNTNGGSIDWEYGDTTGHTKMFSVSTEVGNNNDGFWPPPSRILPLAQENLPANLFFARYVPTLFMPPAIVGVAPTSLNVGVSPEGMTTRQVVVTNTGGQNLIFSTGFGNGTAVTDTGGPDGYGYRWQKSDVACGPTYEWLPISTLGTPLTFGVSGGDSVKGPFNLGFGFPFYGTTYSRMWISANGWISFKDSVNTYYRNESLPSAVAASAAIFGWWDDLKPQLAGTNVRFWTNGIDSAAAHYENVRAGTAPSQGTYNFQILITARGEIKIFYGDMGTLRLNSATIGIQNATKTIGLTALNNSAGVASFEARRFAMGPRWVAVLAPTTGSVAPNSSDTINVLFDGRLLCGDPSLSALLIRSNDPATPIVTIPISASPNIAPEIPAKFTLYRADNRLIFHWSRSENATAYRIEGAPDMEGPFTPFATTADTVYSDTTWVTQPGPTIFRVIATN